MAKRPLTRGQLWIVFLVGLAVLAWMWWNQARRETAYDDAMARIESTLPRGGGAQPTVQLRDGRPTVTVTLDGMRKKGARLRWFWLRMGDTAWDFPYPDEGVDDEAFQHWEATMEPVWAEMVDTLKAAREACRDPTHLRGEIRIPASSAGEVPPGLPVRVLDLFLQAGIEDVVFEGAAGPLPSGLGVEADER